MKNEICIRCKTKMRKKIIRLDLPKGSVEMEGYECPKCGEEIFTHDQALKGEQQAIARRLWGSEMWLRRKVTTIGNSPAIVIPKDIVRHLHIRKGSGVKIRTINNEIIIKPELKMHRNP